MSLRADGEAISPQQQGDCFGANGAPAQKLRMSLRGDLCRSNPQRRMGDCFVAQNAPRNDSAARVSALVHARRRAWGSRNDTVQL